MDAPKSYPDLGTLHERYIVELTGREINLIHAMVAFCEQATSVRFPKSTSLIQRMFSDEVKGWWEQYGDTGKALSARLEGLEGEQASKVLFLLESEHFSTRGQE